MKDVITLSFNEKTITTASGVFSYTISNSFSSVSITGFKINPIKRDGYVVIPDKIEGFNVEYIERRAFAGNEDIKYVILPSNLLCISDNSFINCTSLENVRFPKSLVRIGVRAFENCVSLKEVKLHNVEYIDSNAFACCPAIELFDLGARLKTIPSSLLTNNDNFKIFKIPESVTSILPGAFKNCGIEEIYISKNLNRVSGGAFASMPKLKRFIVDPKNNTLFTRDDVLYKRYFFPENNNVTTYSLVAVPAQKNDMIFNIPNNVNKICSFAFDGSMIHDVNIPNSVSELCHNCFDNTARLEKLKIPSSLKRCDLVMVNSNNIKLIEFSKGIKNITLDLNSNSCPIDIIKLPISLNDIIISDIDQNTKLLFQKETEVSKELTAFKYNVHYYSSKINELLSKIDDDYVIE